MAKAKRKKPPAIARREAALPILRAARDLTDWQNDAAVAGFLASWVADAEPVTIQLDPESALSVIGNLQLALRHPGNTGIAADIAKELIDGLIERLAPDPDDPMRTFLMAGFDPAHDRHGMPKEFDSLEDADAHDFPLHATIGVRSHSAGLLFYTLMESENGQRFWRLTEEFE